jgi:hypothetical protein
MNFQFTWKHEDGSIIEFSEHGWKSDDAEKATWLTEMSDLYSSSPTVPPEIRVWLQRYCRLIACEVLEGMTSTDGSRNTWVSTQMSQIFPSGKKRKRAQATKPNGPGNETQHRLGS